MQGRTRGQREGASERYEKRTNDADNNKRYKKKKKQEEACKKWNGILSHWTPSSIHMRFIYTVVCEWIKHGGREREGRAGQRAWQQREQRQQQQQVDTFMRHLNDTNQSKSETQAPYPHRPYMSMLRVFKMGASNDLHSRLTCKQLWAREKQQLQLSSQPGWAGAG